MNVVQWKERKHTHQNVHERPPGWRPAPDGGLTDRQCKQALWVIALALVMVILGAFIVQAQNGTEIKTKADVDQVKLADEIPFDEPTALKLQIYLRDIQIAQEQQQSAKDREMLAQLRAQAIFDGFIAKNSLKHEEWTLDARRFVVVRRKEAAPATAEARPEKEK